MSDQDIDYLLKAFDNPNHCYPLIVVHAIHLLVSQRDEARKEVFKSLNEMYTTAGLRRELKRRGWLEWYKEVKP
jgi:hypothetical protein